MDPKGKGIVINDKEKETLNINEPKGDKPTNSGSNNKKKDEKKKSSTSISMARLNALAMPKRRG